jgi:hypothetical protein
MCGCSLRAVNKGKLCIFQPKTDGTDSFKNEKKYYINGCVLLGCIGDCLLLQERDTSG